MFDSGVSTGDFASTTAAECAVQSAGAGWDFVDVVCEAGVADACVAGLSAFAARCRVEENVARARGVEAVCEIADVRLVLADVTGGDASLVMRDVVCEVASALRVSQAVARPLVETGVKLERLPLTAVRFVCGVLDWARVLVLASVLDAASASTIAAIEFEAVAAAERVGPRALRSALWRLWYAHDREEAAAAQKSAVENARGVSMRRDGGGGSVLEATLTDVEGAQAVALIDDIAATVCPRDPRSAKQMRADGLMALLHGEHAVECQCGQGEGCPQFGVADLPDRRRGYLVQILIDIDTLLGLGRKPAMLGDGTPVDPEVARVLAEDAHWQGLLVELRDGLAARERENASGADERTKRPPDGENSDDGVSHCDNPGEGSHCDNPGEGSHGENPDGGASNVCGSDPAAPSEPVDATASGPRAWLSRVIFRGRVRGSGAIPAPATGTAGRHGPRSDARGENRSNDPAGVVSEALRVRAIAALLAAVESDPALAAGIHPDGHGGLPSPPAGALTYRPSADLAARTRMTYRTCTHPGCEIPSARCELDHIVPFQHTDPHAGGWTVEANLHPVCKGHHQLKTAKLWTAAMLAGGAILWTSGAGIRSISLPEIGCPSPPRSRKRGRRIPEPDIDAPTWWETHMPADAPEPTAADHTAADRRNDSSDAARIRMRMLRRRFREHTFIRHLRERAEPPPY